MQRVMTWSPDNPSLRGRLLHAWHRIEVQPTLTSRLLLVAWALSRGALLIGLLISHSYCDPAFYNYAGKFANGEWPYTSAVPVEYPPVAMVLILLPAIPLLPFAGIAPRPDAVFAHITTHLPTPNPVRYGAYGISFAIEMLIFDAITLWLIQWAARKYVPGDSTGVRSGMLYILLIFLNGALLQKFDLVAGMFCLVALLALISGRNRLSWSVLALATLIKGFPLLALPVLIGYQLCQSSETDLRKVLTDRARPILVGILWFGATIAACTLPVILFTGLQGITHSLLYQGDRGIEIESLYANGVLLVGWLPGIHVYTIFNPSDLSRIVKSSLDGAIDIVSLMALALFLLLAYGAFWRALRRHWIGKIAGSKAVDDLLQLAGAGIVAIFLAFLLSFRALPAHYLLAIIPIAALVRLPKARLQRLWLAALITVAVAGQLLTMVWHELVLLEPGGVLLLTLRNGAWILVFGSLLLALWQLMGGPRIKPD
ncbi:MAG: hypothetical protein ACLQUY_13140 [Ktedonobacterales bacterium]